MTRELCNPKRLNIRIEKVDLFAIDNRIGLHQDTDSVMGLQAGRINVTAR